MKTIETKRGNQLRDWEQRCVLVSFIYRSTHENAATNPGALKRAGGTLPLIPDARWLEVTDFHVKADGSLDLRRQRCVTHYSEVPEWKVLIQNFASR